MNESIALLKLLTTVAATLTMLGAIFLLLRGRNNRSRRMLAYTFLFWGVAYVARAFCFAYQSQLVNFTPLRLLGVIAGNFFTVSLYLFPLNVVRPGWLTLKRVSCLLAPLVVLPLFYFLMLYFRGEPVEVLHTPAEIVTLLGHFNVWFRLVILSCHFIYTFLFLRMIIKYEREYQVWKNDHFADQDYLDISWMRFYVFVILIVSVAWLLNVFVSSPYTFIIHTFIVIGGFSYILYKGLFLESPYPQDFFTSTSDVGRENLLESSEFPLSGEASVLPETEEMDESFAQKIPEYMDVLTSWMETEKPFLYKDFKLSDASRVLPLNRSYLSRVFNDGFGKSFSEVVRAYRVDYAKQIILHRPDLALYEIASICGFSSDSTFSRSFQKVTGMTPKQFKMSNE